MSAEALPTTAAVLNLMADYEDADRALADWILSRLRPLAAPGRSLRLTVHVEGPKLTVKLDPPPHAVHVQEVKGPMRRTT